MSDHEQKPIRCSYCRKVLEPGSVKYARIWSPNWKKTGNLSPPRPYCREGYCSGDDQMAHEG